MMHSYILKCKAKYIVLLCKRAKSETSVAVLFFVTIIVGHYHPLIPLLRDDVGTQPLSLRPLPETCSPYTFQSAGTWDNIGDCWSYK